MQKGITVGSLLRWLLLVGCFVGRLIGRQTNRIRKFRFAIIFIIIIFLLLCSRILRRMWGSSNAEKAESKRDGHIKQESATERTLKDDTIRYDMPTFFWVLLLLDSRLVNSPVIPDSLFFFFKFLCAVCCGVSLNWRCLSIWPWLVCYFYNQQDRNNWAIMGYTHWGPNRDRWLAR